MNDCKRVNNKAIALLIIILAMFVGFLNPAALDDSFNSLEEFSSFTGSIHAAGGFSNHDAVINMAAGDRSAIAIVYRRSARTGSDRDTSFEDTVLSAVFGAQSYRLLQPFYSYAAAAGFLFISLIYIYYIHLSDGQK